MYFLGSVWLPLERFSLKLMYPILSVIQPTRIRGLYKGKYLFEIPTYCCISRQNYWLLTKQQKSKHNFNHESRIQFYIMYSFNGWLLQWMTYFLFTRKWDLLQNSSYFPRNKTKSLVLHYTLFFICITGCFEHSI